VRIVERPLKRVFVVAQTLQIVEERFLELRVRLNFSIAAKIRFQLGKCQKYFSTSQRPRPENKIGTGAVLLASSRHSAKVWLSIVEDRCPIVVWAYQDGIDLERFIRERHLLLPCRITPPGKCVVLRTSVYNAFWVTSAPYAQFVRHPWAGAWTCTAFRNESSILSSTLIEQAVAATLFINCYRPRFRFRLPRELPVLI